MSASLLSLTLSLTLLRAHPTQVFRWLRLKVRQSHFRPPDRVVPSTSPWHQEVLNATLIGSMVQDLGDHVDSWLSIPLYMTDTVPILLQKRLHTFLQNTGNWFCGTGARSLLTGLTRTLLDVIGGAVVVRQVCCASPHGFDTFQVKTVFADLPQQK